MDSDYKIYLNLAIFLLGITYIGLIGFFLIDLIMIFSFDSNYISLTDSSIRTWVIIEFFLLIVMVIITPLSFILPLSDTGDVWDYGIWGILGFIIAGLVFNFSLNEIDELQTPTTCSVNLMNSLNNSKKYSLYPNLPELEVNEKVTDLVNENCPIAATPRKICFYLAIIAIVFTSWRFLLRILFDIRHI